MRIFLLLLIVVFHLQSFSQISFYQGLRFQYAMQFMKLPIQMQIALADTSKKHPQPQGVAIFSEFALDTLNKDSELSSSADIVLLDPQTRKPIKSHSNKYKQMVLDCYGELSGDTLIIQIGSLWNDQALIMSIQKDSASVFYYKQSVNNAIYKLNINDSLSK